MERRHRGDFVAGIVHNPTLQFRRLVGAGPSLEIDAVWNAGYEIATLGEKLNRHFFGIDRSGANAGFLLADSFSGWKHLELEFLHRKTLTSFAHREIVLTTRG